MIPIGRVSLLACGMFVLLAASFAVSYRAGARPPEGPAPYKPFILHERELYFNPDGKQARPVTERTVARRSDGSTMTSLVTTYPPGGQEITDQMVTILDVPQRLSVVLDPNTRSATTMSLSDEEVSTYLHATQKVWCQGNEGWLSADRSEDRSTMLGLPVVLRTTELGRNKTLSWVAPDINCYALKETRRLYSRNETRITVEDIKRGEPPGSMFAAPPWYTERSPGEVEALFRAKYPGHTLYGGDALVRRLDDTYRKHQKR